MTARVTRADIIAAAEGWLGTPFRHQGRAKGVGCDCAGLLVGVGRELGLPVGDVGGYARQPDGASLRRHCERLAAPVPLAKARAADALLLRTGRHPGHLALLCPGGWIIHADGAIGRVVRTRLTHRWQRRVVAAYRFPGIED